MLVASMGTPGHQVDISSLVGLAWSARCTCGAAARRLDEADIWRWAAFHISVDVPTNQWRAELERS